MFNSHFNEELLSSPTYARGGGKEAQIEILTDSEVLDRIQSEFRIQSAPFTSFIVHLRVWKPQTPPLPLPLSLVPPLARNVILFEEIGIIKYK